MVMRKTTTLCVRALCTIILFLIAAAIFAPIVQIFVPVRIACAKEQYRMIACFSTYYGDSSQNRKHNVALACRKIDGTMLYPEDEFSFNDVVGARTIESGFKSAYIIQNGEFVEGVGGGVCQVSSTLTTALCLPTLQ